MGIEGRVEVGWVQARRERGEKEGGVGVRVWVGVGGMVEGMGAEEGGWGLGLNEAFFPRRIIPEEALQNE